MPSDDQMAYTLTFDRAVGSFDNHVGAAYSKRFTSKYSHRVLQGVGRNVPQEAPRALAQAVVDVDGYRT